MKQMFPTFLALAFAASVSATALARPFNDPRSERSEAIDNSAASEPRDPACYARTLASAGGAYPRNPHTLALRWTGFSNFELVYNGHIILLDAYFDRGTTYPPLGFTAADVKRADVILLGHGHHDHMADAATVGARTEAMVVGAPVTTEKLATQSIPPQQVRTVTGKGGELLKFDGFTVERSWAFTVRPTSTLPRSWTARSTNSCQRRLRSKRRSGRKFKPAALTTAAC
jgi:hypothetical protein